MDAGWGKHEQLLLIALLQNRWSTVAGVAIELLPANFARHFVKRDNALSVATDHRVKQVAFDQRMRRKTPDWNFGREVFWKVAAPDQFTISDRETTQIAITSEDIDSITVDGGSASWAGRIRNAVRTFVLVTPQFFAGF